MQSQNKFFALANHPFKFQIYLLYKLPAAFFSGIKITECNTDRCVTSVPYKWLTQNPFRSTYFASLAMAAEMSTGMLAMSNTFKTTVPISMLVTKMEATYFKKATGITFFTCSEGLKMSQAVSQAVISNEGNIVTVKTTGRNKAGDLIAEFLFTWSFKARIKR